eukprot:TRINITY_DN16376_c0_g1_i1.p1 TRINITY_DN16376_c0_g1~~TRINITY_DN16376_c0_g1_i1.p1  ORF type:complete len:360 (+),score=33.60 TRINITY_DN16376_c0_g1_i1:42-1121(+)
MLKWAAMLGGACGGMYFMRKCIRKEVVDVVVVTDVGKDIDDTMALLFLAELHKKGVINLKGIIACGGRTTDRANVASMLLMSAVPDNEVLIVPGKDTTLCNEPFPNTDVLTHPVTTDHHPHGTTVTVTSLIHNAHVICLGPVTDLAHSISLKSRPKSFLIQGQVTKDLQPDEESYNLRCDIKAAGMVFEKSKEFNIPVVLLGKYAAYECPVKQVHVEYLKANTVLPWDLRNVVLETLREFVSDSGSGDILKRAYGIDVSELRKDVSLPLKEQIWNTFPHLSVPYDPLCCMLLGIVVPESNTLRAFSREFVAKPAGGNFITVGNDSSAPAVRNPERMVDLLCVTAAGRSWEDVLYRQQAR